MPDLDIVERQLRRHWRAPYRLLQGGCPPEDVADLLIKALAATVRDDGGIPGFGFLCEATTRVFSEGGGVKTLAEMGRRLEQEFGQRRSVKLAARAAQKNLVESQYGSSLPGPLAFAEAHLNTLLEHHFFAKVVTGASVGEGKRFRNIQEARQFAASVHACAEPQLKKMAKKVVSDPTASKLRAPKSSRRQRTTAELLDAPL